MIEKSKCNAVLQYRQDKLFFVLLGCIKLEKWQYCFFATAPRMKLTVSYDRSSSF